MTVTPALFLSGIQTDLSHRRHVTNSNARLIMRRRPSSLRRYSQVGDWEYLRRLDGLRRVDAEAPAGANLKQ
jgi:hypothetical protein